MKLENEVNKKEPFLYIEKDEEILEKIASEIVNISYIKKRKRVLNSLITIAKEEEIIKDNSLIYDSDSFDTHNPFQNVKYILEKDKKEKIEYKKPKNVVKNLCKIANRGYLVSVEYLVAKGYINEYEKDPSRAIEDAGHDRTDISELISELKIFIDATDFYYNRLEKLTNTLIEKEYLTKIEPDIAADLPEVIVKIGIGGIDPETQKGIGFLLVAADEYEHKKRTFKKHASKLHREELNEIGRRIIGDLDKNKTTIIQKAYRVNQVFGDEVKEQIERFLSNYQEKEEAKNTVQAYR